MSKIERNDTKTSNSGRKIIFSDKTAKKEPFFGSPFSWAIFGVWMEFKAV